jgi:uncharacterized protein YjlB
MIENVDPAVVESYTFTTAKDVPNNPDLPLLIYRGVLSLKGDAARACEDLFDANAWKPDWRDTVYDYHHFHSTAHEALGIVRGEAIIRFGGEEGRAIRVSAGDVIVIPAGVGHRNEGSSDLLVVGAYPAGQDWDLCPPKPDERECSHGSIADVALPKADPVFGSKGPLLHQWRHRQGS